MKYELIYSEIKKQIDTMTNDLELSQNELIKKLVEADSKALGQNREPFERNLILGTYKAEIHHKCLPDSGVECHIHDLELLESNYFISYVSNGLFYITQNALKYVKKLRTNINSPTQRTETDIKSYIKADTFRSKHINAYEKWTIAENMLSNIADNDMITMVGHCCREALQTFATDLVEEFKPEGVDKIKTNVKNRIIAVVEKQLKGTSKEISNLMNSLIEYWASVNDLAQRQEHGALKEGGNLNIEDARRLVFHTLLVMYEIDRTLSGK